jgi:hypothetical protein
LNGFIENSLDQYLGMTESSVSWRIDSFVRTRALLAYSATFLLVLLLAFNLLVARNLLCSPKFIHDHKYEGQNFLGLSPVTKTSPTVGW